MKVVFYDTKPYDRIWFEPMLKDAGVEVRFYEYKLSPDTAAFAKGAAAICIFVNDECGADTIEALADAGVKVILLRCSGYNNVDLNAAASRNIPVLRVPTYSPAAVAEYAMGLVLAANRKIPRAYARARVGNFSINGFLGFDLEGRTAGVIGTGQIGRKFVKICKAFDMNVVAYDKYPDNTLGVEYTTLDDLFERSDIISLHCPLTKETRHVINADAISRMKDGVIIVNTSRGALVDTSALLDGLKSRKIGGAGLDVYEEEDRYFFEDFSNEVITDDELLQLLSIPNAILSSHQAFFTEDALRAIAEVTVGNLLDYRDDRELRNRVLSENTSHASNGSKIRF